MDRGQTLSNHYILTQQTTVSQCAATGVARACFLFQVVEKTSHPRLRKMRIFVRSNANAAMQKNVQFFSHHGVTDWSVVGDNCRRIIKHMKCCRSSITVLRWASSPCTHLIKVASALNVQSLDSISLRIDVLPCAAKHRIFHERGVLSCARRLRTCNGTSGDKNRTHHKDRGYDLWSHCTLSREKELPAARSTSDRQLAMRLWRCSRINS